MTTTRVLALAIAWAVTLGAAGAQAQSGSGASLTGAARDLFRDGMQAAEAGRWEDARAAFERSYELAPRDSTLLNLAVALGQTGRLVAAIEAYRRFLARADETTRAQGEAHARDAVAALEARIAHVSLTVRGLEEGDVVALDEVEIAHAAMGLDLPVDPGAHVVTVTRDGRECARRALELAESARRDLELVAMCPPPPPIEPELELTPTPVEPEDQSEDPAPWIALGVGAGAAVIAGIVIAAVVVASQGPRDPGPFMGNLGPGSFPAP
ncbi:hypothetical protein [Sandaracinus amylolyticus]|uniref:hypothetical protein n=1 Tax=Sandaracinus amylolyticus TaxID=927083 RepID=UPI001F2F4784|nr:hypothetical protein [Sandaracinus amylolyticus]UJR82960.1 Hypothetical protein I5071_50250 [Sandaracinus amylolyticus]